MCYGKEPSKKGVEGVKLKESFQKAGIPKDLNITAPKHKLQVNCYCSLSSFFQEREIMVKLCPFVMKICA